VRNPHFDDNRIIWSNDYSGLYTSPPTGTDQQFELQWKLALEGREGYTDTPGAGLDDKHIDDRIYTWTGKHPSGNGFHDPRAVQRVLDHPVDVELLIRGKRCADVGCGMGRWTKALQRMDAQYVLSIDVAESSINSVKRFNENVLRADILQLDKEHPELAGTFDFVNLWGVAHHTYDPWLAFRNAAALLKPKGAMYLYVYAETGLHNDPLVNLQRKLFYNLKCVDDRLAFVERVYHRKWDWRYPLKRNFDNMLANLSNQPKGVRICVLDMLETYYNWVIPWDVVTQWMASQKFDRVIHLNELEPIGQKCGYHVLGLRGFGS
jgi:SAM-dependent methyltransferase